MAKHKNRGDLIDELAVTQSQGNRARMRLIVHGKADQAKDVQEATAKVTIRIDDLLAQEIDDWIAVAKSDVEDVEALNADLKKVIKKIKKRKKVFENAVKAVGFIERAVEKSAKYVA